MHWRYFLAHIIREYTLNRQITLINSVVEKYICTIMAQACDSPIPSRTFKREILMIKYGNSVGIWVFVVCLLFPQFAIAQSYPPMEPIVEWEKRLGAEERMQALGPDLLGDRIDPHTGAISFEHVDVSLPGNFPLPVEIRRTRSQGYLYADAVKVEFGDWELSVPKITILLSNSANWSGDLCSNPVFPSILMPGPSWKPVTDYSNGMSMRIPGGGSQAVLKNINASIVKTGSNYATVEGWSIRCGGGNSFIATAPNGDAYTFNRIIKTPYVPFGASTYNYGHARNQVNVVATEVRDVNGNWVRYVYDTGDRLAQVHASDGRSISLGYTSGSDLIRSVTANGRIWNYSYGITNFQKPEWEYHPQVPLNISELRSVTRPDGKSWAFSLDNMHLTPTPALNCPKPQVTISVTHPMGVTGTFKLKERKHRQSLDSQVRKPVHCFFGEPPMPSGPGSLPNPLIPTFISSVSVLEKTLTGPTLTPAVWSYEYESDPSGPGANPGDHTNWSTITDPSGTVTTTYHLWPWEQDTGGKLVKTEIRDSSLTPLQENDTQYAATIYCYGTAVATISALNNRVGCPALVTQQTTSRPGNGSDIWYTKNTYNTNTTSSLFSHGLPVKVEKWSNFQTAKRTTDIEYQHNTALWVIGLPTKSNRTPVSNTA
jgi:hypothetical protein